MTSAKEILSSILKDIAEREKYKENEINIKKMSSGGANYSSQLYLATISAPSGEDLKLFAKIANIGGQLREEYNNFYSTEKYVYKTLEKYYRDLQDKHNVPHEYRFVFPKMYGYNEQVGFETIVLEDLVAQGYRAYDRFKPITWEHATAIVKALARFHAPSFAFEKEYPDEYKKALKVLKPKPLTENSAFTAWLKHSFQNNLQHVQEEYKEKIKTIFDGDDLHVEYDKLMSPLRKAVLIHGDYRPSNIMYSRQRGKVRLAVLDYQTVRAGSPATDLTYLIALSTDEQFRRLFYEKLVEYYHEALNAALRMFGMDVEEVYSMKMFLEEMHEMKSSFLLVALCIMHVIFIDAESAPKSVDELMKDIDSGQSTPIKINRKKYEERLHGILRDMERWGVL